MVGVGFEGKKSVLARVAIVNAFGHVLYDKFVKPKEFVTDYRTHVSGVTPEALEDGMRSTCPRGSGGILTKENGALEIIHFSSIVRAFGDAHNPAPIRCPDCNCIASADTAAIDFAQVQKDVYELMKDRILVGHSLSNDMKVLMLSHPKHMVRDTSKYREFRRLVKGRTPGLRKLTHDLLQLTIQEGEHSPVCGSLGGRGGGRRVPSKGSVARVLCCLHVICSWLGLIPNSPIRSYRYTVAMFPLPYKNVLKYPTRQNVGGISILVSIQNVPESAAHILPRAVLRIGL
jgi:DNA polymerase III epsilon subunit-like protein